MLYSVIYQTLNLGQGYRKHGTVLDSASKCGAMLDSASEHDMDAMGNITNYKFNLM